MPQTPAWDTACHAEHSLAQHRQEHKPPSLPADILRTAGRGTRREARLLRAHSRRAPAGAPVTLR